MYRVSAHNTPSIDGSISLLLLVSSLDPIVFYALKIIHLGPFTYLPEIGPTSFTLRPLGCVNINSRVLSDNYVLSFATKMFGNALKGLVTTLYKRQQSSRL
jgi:hypothetical protein